MPDLILASSSPYRRELLTRLCLPLKGASPDINEGHHPGENAEELVRHLSASKVEVLAGRYPQHLMIGFDQVAALDSDILGRPHTPERATQQLRDTNGKSMTFLTGLVLLNSVSRCIRVACVPFIVHFRHLDENRIYRHAEAEHPRDCAGSSEVEGLGASLFRTTEGEDAISLVGLPLIRLVDILPEGDVEIP